MRAAGPKGVQLRWRGSGGKSFRPGLPRVARASPCHFQGGGAALTISHSTWGQPRGPPVTVRVALVAWEPQVQAYSPVSSRRKSRNTSSATWPRCCGSQRSSACSSRPPLLQTTVALGSDSSHRRLAEVPSSA